MVRSTFRSVTYDLDTSLALARLVGAADDGLASDELAVALGYSGVRNGAYLTRLANTRLFGLVTGPSTRVVLTERGRRALSTDGEVAGPARAAAFLAVPLYRAVLERCAGSPVPPVAELDALLQSEFGEPAGKSRTTATKLLDSVRQAGLLRLAEGEAPNSQFPRFTDFTDTGLPDTAAIGSRLGHRRHERTPRGRADRSRRVGSEVADEMSSTPSVDSGAPPDETDGLWLDEPADGRRGVLRRRTAVAAAVAICVAVVAVPVSYALTGSIPTAQHSASKQGTVAHLKAGPQAVSEVLNALSATTTAGNFDFTYNLTGTAATMPSPSTTTTVPQTCPTVNGAMPVPGGNLSAVPGASSCGVQVVPAPVVSNTPVTGGGTIDVNPTAMVTTATVGSGGSPLQVVVREDNTNYWETSGTASLAPGSGQTGAGSPLSSFAGLVESTLGTREGAVAMLGMASPSGYLDLDQQQVTNASQVGSGTAGGVPVTIYQVEVSPAQEAQVTGASTEEMTTITDALATLKAEGYTGTIVRLSVDGEGYVREADSTAHFSDGGTALLDVTLSDFGCAGTVLMPGQQGSGTPPAGCTSPVPTTTTTATPSGSSTTTSSPTTSTTVAPRSSSTTTSSATPTTLVVPPDSSVPTSTTNTTSSG